MAPVGAITSTILVSYVKVSPRSCKSSLGHSRKEPVLDPRSHPSVIHQPPPPCTVSPSKPRDATKDIGALAWTFSQQTLEKSRGRRSITSSGSQAPSSLSCLCGPSSRGPGECLGRQPSQPGNNAQMRPSVQGLHFLEEQVELCGFSSLPSSPSTVRPRCAEVWSKQGARLCSRNRRKKG